MPLVTFVDPEGKMTPPKHLPAYIITSYISNFPVPRKCQLDFQLKKTCGKQGLMQRIVTMILEEEFNIAELQEI